MPLSQVSANSRDGLRFNVQALSHSSKQQNKDICVLGAGVMGLSVALQLRQVLPWVQLMNRS